MTDLRRVAILAAAASLLVPALLPQVVAVVPVIYFDVDPRSAAGQIAVTSIGPAGAAWLHTLSLAAAAAAVGVAAWAGARIQWWACGLFVVGAAFAGWHMPATLDDALQGGAWISGAALALGAAHLAQHDPARRLFVAAFVAMLVPLAINTLRYVFYEHPMTVESYLANEAEMLQSRGWEEGTPQHVLYRRRLTDPAAVGAVGLSNVFGSVVAALALMALALAHGLFWSKRTRWWSLVAVGVAVAGGTTLVLTHSKGAIAAFFAGGVLLAVIVAARRWPRLRPGVPAAAAALVVAAIAAVMVRGWLGPPETWEGERSLLFRWHYWQAAVRMVADAPLLGVGPSGFADAYLRTKVPINPEEVTSAHNVFVDFVAMLGVGGWAWSALLLGWLWLGAQRAATNEDQPADPEPLSRIDLAAPATVAVFVFGVQRVVQSPRMYIDDAVLWLVGAAGFIAVAGVLWRAVSRVPGWAIVAAAVAAATLLVHNQIEMAFFNLSALPAAFVIVGMAGASDPPLRRPTASGRPALRLAPAAAMLVATGVFVTGYASPVSQQQGALADATAFLQRGQPVQAIGSLDRAAEFFPDSRTLRWRVSLRLEGAAALAAAGRRADAELFLADAAAVVRNSRIHGATPRRLLGTVLEQRAALLGDAAALREAVAARQPPAPYSIPDHLALGDLHWRLGDGEAARRLYTRALELSDLNYLDPGKQLAPVERREIEARLTGR